MTNFPKSRWRCLAVCLTILCFILITIIVAVVVMYIRHPCSTGDSVIDTSEPDKPGIFNDLTQKELKAISDYMYSLNRFKLLAPPAYALNASHIYATHLYLPPKQDVLKYLDEGGSQSARQAKVILFRGDINPPQVEEYIVGPLPEPNSCDLLVSSSRKNPIPFGYRPYNIPEIITLFTTVLEEIDKKIGHILLESYDAKFTECGRKCLVAYPCGVSSAILGDPDRKIWIRTLRKVERENLHPLDFEFLLDVNTVYSSSYIIEKVRYSGRLYAGLEELARLYNTSAIPKTKAPFPDVSQNLFSTMHLRGHPVPASPKAPPRLFEPNGRRFSVRHGQISYMQWQVQMAMHPLLGPRIYDVRFRGDRIAYEVSLQEIAVFYSGLSPSVRLANFVDTVSNLGIRSVSLVPSADCPETAVFLDSHVLNELDADPYLIERSVCVFEQNTGVPLRRHLATDLRSQQYYAGMMDNVLIMRSIHAAGNYDYVVDYILHQNGGLETRVASTGYISSTYNIVGEEQYGYQIHDNIIGSIHQHLFHFKVDLDIFGTSNRYETLDISSERVDNQETTGKPDKNFWQIKPKRNLKRSEMEAAYKFNFDNPKYHIIYNEEEKIRSGVPKAYRIHSTGLHKQLLPENAGNEQEISWARYQTAFTKVKDDERESSSVYAMMDSGDPVVNFTSFLADNESIVDEDIVAWLTLGLYHIPHTEDLPVTSTVGGHLGFFLLPFNYFDECPSVSSRDAIRRDPKNPAKPAEGLKVTRYSGNQPESNCVPRQTFIDEDGVVKS